MRDHYIYWNSINAYAENWRARNARQAISMPSNCEGRNAEGIARTLKGGRVVKGEPTFAYIIIHSQIFCISEGMHLLYSTKGEGLR